VTEARPPRCRPLPPEVLAAVRAVAVGTPDAELFERLEDALATLPDAERAAVVTALGYAEGPVGAAIELGLPLADATSLVDSGLQLLRGALADVEPDTRAVHGVLERTRRSGPHAE
jgi:DNA-directed RNA polymerase specialized sigma24 family protein